MEGTSEYAGAANYPYLTGVYLAVNAIPDVRLFLDGPDCGSFKAHFIHGRHDLFSTLFDCAGTDRIKASEVTVDRLVGDRTPFIEAGLMDLASTPNTGAVLVTSMPMATLTGTQYDLIQRAVGSRTRTRFIEVPALSLSRDWLDGYSEVLAALASSLELAPSNPQEGKVAVVGYMMDRTERDHFANVEELERILTGLGLEPVSFWLSNRPCEHLARAAEAGTIISLPHGRKAARILAKRTSATVIEPGVPFGLGPTVRWVRDVAAPLGLSARAEDLISREAGPVARSIQWLVPKYLFGAKVLFCGDPYLFEPVIELLEELGSEPSALISVGARRHLDPLPESVERHGPHVLFEPTQAQTRELVLSVLGRGGIDACIQSDTFGLAGRGSHAVVPFGFATWSYHAVFDAPYLGFRGATCFIDRLANALIARLRHE